MGKPLPAGVPFKLSVTAVASVTVPSTVSAATLVTRPSAGEVMSRAGGWESTVTSTLAAGLVAGAVLGPGLDPEVSVAGGEGGREQVAFGHDGLTVHVHEDDARGIGDGTGDGEGRSDDGAVDGGGEGDDGRLDVEKDGDGSFADVAGGIGRDDAEHVARGAQRHAGGVEGGPAHGSVDRIHANGDGGVVEDAAAHVDGGAHGVGVGRGRDDGDLRRDGVEGDARGSDGLSAAGVGGGHLEGVRALVESDVAGEAPFPNAVGGRALEHEGGSGTVDARPGVAVPQGAGDAQRALINVGSDGVELDGRGLGVDGEHRGGGGDGAGSALGDGLERRGGRRRGRGHPRPSPRPG